MANSMRGAKATRANKAIKARSGITSLVFSYIEREALWPAPSRLVVAVSGGADSLCLFGLLLDLQSTGHMLAPSGLVVAHLDHGIRGEASAEDALWVGKLAASLGVPFFTERVEVKALARAGHLSSEDAARRARYSFLRRTAAKVSAGRICTGHTADDQVETIVMHWLRGSGLRGLAGMPPRSGDIVRPLLCINHGDAVAYCAERGWTPRQDETNDDIRYTRNRVRHELLPYLERYNPNLRQTLLRNAELLASDEAYLTQEVERVYATICGNQTTQSVTLDLLALRHLAPALSRMVIRRAARHLASDTSGQALEARHIFQIEHLLTSSHTGRQLCLPGNLVVERGYRTVVLRKQAVTDHKATLAHEVLLTVPGECILPELGWRLRTEVVEMSAMSPVPGQLRMPELKRQVTGESVYPIETMTYLDADATGDSLFVRTWRDGDRFRPFGMQHEKKLQDFFMDARIPRESRRQIPLIVNSHHLIWVAGLRQDDRVRITAETKRILVIHMEPL